MRRWLLVGVLLAAVVVPVAEAKPSSLQRQIDQLKGRVATLERANQTTQDALSATRQDLTTTRAELDRLRNDVRCSDALLSDLIIILARALGMQASQVPDGGSCAAIGVNRQPLSVARTLHGLFR